MKARLAAPDESGLAQACALLEEGQPVAIPTETVYGLACNALDPRACARVFAVKNRPHWDPLIVHVHDLAQAERLAHWSPLARQLAQAFWPGPLTLVLPRRDVIPDAITAGRDTVAVRAPSHPVARALLARLDFPLAAPSANPFGYLSPTCAEHVAHMLGERLALILDGGPTEHGVESTIVRLESSPTLLRPGAIPAAAIEAILGRKLLPATAGAGTAPGMSPRHYSPRTPLGLFPCGATPPAGGPHEAILYVRQPRPSGARPCYVLSRDGSLADAARNLYAQLHAMEAQHYVRIDCELAPEADLGATLNDRLRRAAART